ncbi:MAG: peptide-methionine (S)-S-oxide reductase MsrA [Xanthomonadaceae bacterium]|jgi:peptide-methionine (S)-S-oxide reductase|nr:peptide-methionine (S)-S-oxide reductase MsrA [Xanthomonadaceae bacterium]
MVDSKIPGSDRAEMPLSNVHFVNGRPLRGDFPGMAVVDFGMGCFWGVERKFWQLPGVITTAAGYAGGHTAHPTYEEVCSGATGHVEVVRVVHAPKATTFEQLLQTFWENHDPTQGLRQGNDVGEQYRSVIFCCTQEQYDLAVASREVYQARLDAVGLGRITTEIRYPAPPFYYAEEYHQQYLAKNPQGYCGLGGTGVGCPAGLAP